METVADRIRMRREELHMTQADLAEKMGLLDKSSVSKIEKSGNDITLKNIERIAKILKVTPSYLMGWVPSPDDLPSLLAVGKSVDYAVFEDDEIKFIIESFRKYNKDGRMKLIDYIQYLNNSDKNIQ